MRKLLIISMLMLSLQSWGQSVYYVAPDGNDSNPGTIVQPWGTWQKAFNEADAGDTVFFRGGIYYSQGVNRINPELYGGGVGNSGSTGMPICYFGYPPDVAQGNKPVLDCRNNCDYVVPNASGDTYNGAISMQYVEHIKFKDIIVRNVSMCGNTRGGGIDPRLAPLSAAISATYSRHLTFENVTVHQVGQRGFYIAGGAWRGFYDQGYTDVIPYWPTANDTTSWINCDVFDICDTFAMTGFPPVQDAGNGGDAFKTIHYTGNHVIWDGCRMWNYVDNAIDPSMLGGTAYINNTWAMSGNKYLDILAYYGGGQEGNGYKFACPPNSTIDYPIYTLTNSLAMFMHTTETGGGHGILNNLNLHTVEAPGNFGRIYNNTVYGCAYGIREAAKNEPLNYSNAIFRNNISYNNTNYNFFTATLGMVQSNNTWQSGIVSDSDFETVNAEVLIGRFTAPRNIDGSLPPFPLRLVENSAMVDAGVQIPSEDNSFFTKLFVGDSPDIGAYEYCSDQIDSTATDITAFTISGQTGISTINTTAHTVGVTMPHGTTVTSLTPSISVSSGATVDPLSGTARNFTSPVTYTVTAADETTTQVWTVTVTVASAPPSSGAGLRQGKQLNLGRAIKYGTKYLIIDM